MEFTLPTLDEIQIAARRIAEHAHRTPVMTCSTLDGMTGATLFFKCENFQKAGAFKFRGAYNAISSLHDAEAARGVVTHSSGNHAAAVALAARYRGITAHVVMPENAPAAKRAAVQAYGGKIIPCATTPGAREATAQKVLDETGGTLVHPYDDPRVIAGQGTVALEFLEQRPDLDIVIAPVSGGGLLSGIALACHGLDPRTEVFGAEPELADDAARSLAAGKLVAPVATTTIADGLRASLSERTFHVFRQHVRCIITVSELQILDATRLIWERMKIIVEPSGAVPLAAVLARREAFHGRRVGLVLSGGNLDLDHVPWAPPGRSSNG